MESRYLYLTLDLCSVAIPFVFSFYTKAPFYKKWKFVFPAIATTGILFLIWDEIFTRNGVWGFNERYLTGIYLGSLPLEEILFFICIPYACVFTYEALNFLIKKDYLQRVATPLSIVLIVVLTIVGVANIDKLYTSVAFISLSGWLVILQIKKVTFLGRFYLAYLIIMIPFFVINGILTGSWIDEQVVWYNNDENLSIRLGTIPMEDVFYGMLLILMNVSIIEFLQVRKILIMQR